MPAAYVDLEMLFIDSVLCGALRNLLRLRGLLAWIIGLLTDLLSGNESAIEYEGGFSSCSPVHT